MAFDFERYLQSYEPTNVEFSKIQSLGGASDDMPDVAKFSTSLPSDAGIDPAAKLKSHNGNHLLPLDRLMGISSQGGTPGVDILESRFRAGQDPRGKPDNGRGRKGFFKQTSLPASLGVSCGSRSKTDNAGRRRRNSVRFADEVGENLTTFLMIPSRFEDGERDAKARLDSSTSTSDKLDISTNRGRIIPATVSTDAKTDGTLENRETPSFQLCFDQPAATLEEFRRRLFFQFVCLENVRVDVTSQADGTTNGFVNHSTVLCTIKVRNLHPMKRVFARCTVDNWRTYADIAAVYIAAGTTASNDYDTFTFALRNPLRYQDTESSEHSGADAYSRKTASVEFALCYEVLGSAYWDNNDGHNYRIVWM